MERKTTIFPLAEKDCYNSNCFMAWPGMATIKKFWYYRDTFLLCCYSKFFGNCCSTPKFHHFPVKALKVHYITFSSSAHGLKDTHVPRNLSKVKTSDTNFYNVQIRIHLDFLESFTTCKWTGGRKSTRKFLGFRFRFNLDLTLYLELGQDEALRPAGL